MKYKKVITRTKSQKLKVALILTGFMRNWDFNYPFIKKEILDTYDPDVYINWPNGEKLVSDKDRKLPYLKQIETKRLPVYK